MIIKKYEIFFQCTAFNYIHAYIHASEDKIVSEGYWCENSWVMKD